MNCLRTQLNSPSRNEKRRSPIHELRYIDSLTLSYPGSIERLDELNGSLLSDYKDLMPVLGSQISQINFNRRDCSRKS